MTITIIIIYLTLTLLIIILSELIWSVFHKKYKDKLEKELPNSEARI